VTLITTCPIFALTAPSHGPKARDRPRPCAKKQRPSCSAVSGSLRRADQPLLSPAPSTFWAAGFSFSRGEVVIEVPYDPYLPFLFFGEEIAMAVRMWTRGWDLFAPDEQIVFHRWSRCYRSTFWEVEGGAPLKKASQARVRRLLTGEPLGCNVAPTVQAMEPAVGGEGESAPAAGPAAGPAADAPVWGVGAARSLAEYEELAGIDFRALSVGAQAERGGMPGEDFFWDRFACLDALVAARSPG